MIRGSFERVFAGSANIINEVYLMALAAIPDEINQHIEAVLALSKRDVLLKILREADICFQLEQITAAAVLAGVALEEVSSLRVQTASNREQATIGAWREIRNRATHLSSLSSGETELDKEAVKAMIAGVRTLVETAEKLRGQLPNIRVTKDAITKTRGKYAFVPTSVDEFLKRKRDDLDLENDK